MDSRVLSASTISTDSLYKAPNEFNEKCFENLSSKLPQYNQSFHQTMPSLFKKKPPTSNKSLDQRNCKITFEKPSITLLGDQDNMMFASSISDIHLKSSGILAQTILKSKHSNIDKYPMEALDFLDIESQPYNTSLYLDTLSEINTISSILIRNNKESFDFPRRNFNIKRKPSKATEKEPNPTESAILSTKPSLHNFDDFVTKSSEVISLNEVDKVLDYFDMRLQNDDNFERPISNETITSLFIEQNNYYNGNETDEEQLYEILNNSTERSFEMPILKRGELLTPILEERSEFLTTITEERSELDINQLPSPKFLMNGSDSLEIENIISKNSMIEEPNNMYFSFAELLNGNSSENANFQKKEIKNTGVHQNKNSNKLNIPLPRPKSITKTKGIEKQESTTKIAETLRNSNGNAKNSNGILRNSNDRMKSFHESDQKGSFRNSLAEKSDKIDSFSQYFKEDHENSSFESFYESIVKKKHETGVQNAVLTVKKPTLIERKENGSQKGEVAYIRKIISSTNGKKTNSNNKENVNKGKKELNFKRNKAKDEDIR